MINEKMYKLGSKRSVIREIFEYAKKRGGEIGAENVFDFSIGNPSVPAPACVEEAILRIVRETPSVRLHGYTSAQGDKDCRDRIAANLNARFGAGLSGRRSLYDLRRRGLSDDRRSCAGLRGGRISRPLRPILPNTRYLSRARAQNLPRFRPRTKPFFPISPRLNGR